MYNIEWIFSGIGTEIVIFLCSILFGGTLIAGCKIIIGKKTFKQKAGNNSIQIQNLSNVQESSLIKFKNEKYTQEAGNNSVQFQEVKDNGNRK